MVRSDWKNESSEPQPARLAKAPENIGKPPEQEPKVIVFPLAGKSEHPLTAIDLAELSKWKLTQPQWDKALDLLIEARQEENLPGLSDIYAALRNASYSDYAGRSNAYGWLYFELNGKSYAFRVVKDRGIGLIASLRYRDAQGNEMGMQQHVGAPVAVHILRDAINVICAPDHPAAPEPEEMPTKKQQAAWFADRVSDGCGRKIA